MKYLIGCIISYALLYAVIYLHEVGHGFFFWLYGCKANPFKVTVRPELMYSTPQPYDAVKLSMLTRGKYVMTCTGGLLANILLAAVMSAVFFGVKCSCFYQELAICQFLLLNLCEAVTYLFPGSIYPVSDMAGIYGNVPKLRLPGLIAGLLLTGYCVYIFTRVPSELLVLTSVFNGVTAVCLSVCRILFSIKNKRDGG